VDKDFTSLFKAIGEFAEVPDTLPYGSPRETSTEAAGAVM